MKHTSVSLGAPCEFINVTPLNPLISKCAIKVCYVSDEPNRNRTVITKDVALQMANSLPGSPIVGYYNEKSQDFEAHNEEIVFEDDKICFKPTTKPYGFVDLNAKCWFEKFIDDGSVEREYLMTEGYLWTGQYPETKRILESGNNQSMELDTKTLKGNWVDSDNEAPEFFIINEALISKLCILGEEYEPCFEGASIKKCEFSLNDSFKEELSLMISQLQNFIEGGKEMSFEELKEEQLEFKKEDEKEEKKNPSEPEEDTSKKEDEPSVADKEEKEPETKEEDDKDKKKKSNFEKEVCEECGKPLNECTCADSEKKYCLDDVVEYQQLLEKYSELESAYQAVLEAKEQIEAKVENLQQFKLQAERKEKEAMIDSFYMLSEEDKKDVVNNIDSYSVDDIEKTLSVICVRNKVSFNLEEDNDSFNSYSLNVDNLGQDSAPAWVLAARAVQHKNN